MYSGPIESINILVNWLPSDSDITSGLWNSISHIVFCYLVMCFFSPFEEALIDNSGQQNDTICDGEYALREAILH